MSSEWIPVGALGDAFIPDNNCLPPIPDLAGKEFTLHFSNGWEIKHSFNNEQELTWTVLKGEANPVSDTDTYIATRPRDGIYFVDFQKKSEAAMTVSLVLDINNGVFLAVIGQLPTAAEAGISMLQRAELKQDLTGVKGTFLTGTIDKPYNENSPFAEITTDLIGKRVEYTYSPAEKYEHIYLNENYYTWHCLSGSEMGLAETDACTHYKVAPDLYLFVWREKVVPTLGVICIDFRAMKTTGKIFGYEHNDCATTRNFSVGAYAKILSILTR